MRNAFVSTLLIFSMFAQPSKAIYENAPIAKTNKITLSSGVSIQDMRIGDGEEVS